MEECLPLKKIKVLLIIKRKNKIKVIKVSFGSFCVKTNLNTKSKRFSPRGHQSLPSCIPRAAKDIFCALQTELWQLFLF